MATKIQNPLSTRSHKLDVSANDLGALSAMDANNNWDYQQPQQSGDQGYESAPVTPSSVRMTPPTCASIIGTHDSREVEDTCVDISFSQNAPLDLRKSHNDVQRSEEQMVGQTEPNDELLTQENGPIDLSQKDAPNDKQSGPSTSVKLRTSPLLSQTNQNTTHESDYNIQAPVHGEICEVNTNLSDAKMSYIPVKESALSVHESTKDKAPVRQLTMPENIAMILSRNKSALSVHESTQDKAPVRQLTMPENIAMILSRKKSALSVHESTQDKAPVRQFTMSENIAMILTRIPNDYIGPEDNPYRSKVSSKLSRPPLKYLPVDVPLTTSLLPDTSRTPNINSVPTNAPPQHCTPTPPQPPSEYDYNSLSRGIPTNFDFIDSNGNTLRRFYQSPQVDLGQSECAIPVLGPPRPFNTQLPVELTPNISLRQANMSQSSRLCPTIWLPVDSTEPVARSSDPNQTYLDTDLTIEANGTLNSNVASRPAFQSVPSSEMPPVPDIQRGSTPIHHLPLLPTVQNTQNPISVVEDFNLAVTEDANSFSSQIKSSNGQIQQNVEQIDAVNQIKSFFQEIPSGYSSGQTLRQLEATSRMKSYNGPFLKNLRQGDLICDMRSDNYLSHQQLQHIKSISPINLGGGPSHQQLRQVGAVNHMGSNGGEIHDPIHHITDAGPNSRIPREIYQKAIDQIRANYESNMRNSSTSRTNNDQSVTTCPTVSTSPSNGIPCNCAPNPVFQPPVNSQANYTKHSDTTYSSHFDTVSDQGFNNHAAKRRRVTYYPVFSPSVGNGIPGTGLCQSAPESSFQSPVTSQADYTKNYNKTYVDLTDGSQYQSDLYCNDFQRNNGAYLPNDCVNNTNDTEKDDSAESDMNIGYYHNLIRYYKRKEVYGNRHNWTSVRNKKSMEDTNKSSVTIDAPQNVASAPINAPKPEASNRNAPINTPKQGASNRNPGNATEIAPNDSPIEHEATQNAPKSIQNTCHQKTNETTREETRVQEPNTWCCKLASSNTSHHECLKDDDSDGSILKNLLTVKSKDDDSDEITILKSSDGDEVQFSENHNDRGDKAMPTKTPGANGSCLSDLFGFQRTSDDTCSSHQNGTSDVEDMMQVSSPKQHDNDDSQTHNISKIVSQKYSTVSESERNIPRKLCKRKRGKSHRVLKFSQVTDILLNIALKTGNAKMNGYSNVTYEKHLEREIDKTSDK